MRQFSSLFHGSNCYASFFPLSWNLPSYKFRFSEALTQSVCFLVCVVALTDGEEIPLWWAFLQTKYRQCLQWIPSGLSADPSPPWLLLVVTLQLLNAPHTMWPPELNSGFHTWSGQHRGEGDTWQHQHNSIVNDQMHVFFKRYVT